MVAWGLSLASGGLFLGGSLAWWVRWGVRGEVVGVTFTWWCLTSRGPTFTRRGQVFSSLLLCISLGFVGLLSQFFNNETNNIMIIIF